MSEQVNIEDNSHRIEYFRRRKFNFSPHICPRCKAWTVSRPMRMCLNCKGILLFPNDTGTFADDKMEDWYCWTTTNGITGWVHKSYFNVGDKKINL